MQKMGHLGSVNDGGVVIMGKVMDVKQMFLEEDVFSLLCSLLSRAHRQHLQKISLEHIWFSPTQILHGPQ